MSYLDLRTLADEWQTLLEDAEQDDEAAADISEECQKYRDLCESLGCDASPDDLRREGDRHEPTLISDDAFEDYARKLAEDIGAIDPNASWPLNCIDWERAARELQMDYSSVTFDGSDYFIRST